MSHSSPTNDYTYANMWIRKGSTTILAAKMSAGVAPVVNLMNQLHIGDKAGKKSICI